VKVITEIDLREKFKKEQFDTFTICYPEKLTPSALQFLSERKIKILEMKDGQNAKNPKIYSTPKDENVSVKEPENGYLLMDNGQVVNTKPEAYTHLKGNLLIPKNHKRIRFRGQVDKLEAAFIDTIIEIQSIGLQEIVSDLEIAFEYTKRIMRAEVLGEELPFIDFKGWGESEIREYSHYPDKYFGVKHFTPEPKYGRVISKLNLLRATVREVEITAVDAFYNEDSKTVERQDIIIALNRMSSLLYIFMCRYMGGLYKIL